MDPLKLLEHAHKLGLTVALDGEQLRIIGPKTPDAATLVQQIAQHKAAVIERLQAIVPEANATSPTAEQVELTDDSLLDPHTADLYSLYGYWLTADELATVRQRYSALTIEARQDREMFAITLSYPVGAQLWQGQAGVYVIT